MMLLLSKNNIKYIIDERMELIFAIHAAYKRMSADEDLDWVETPNISYVNELMELIDIRDQHELCQYIENAWNDIGRIPSLATIFDENFNLIEERISPIIKDCFQYGNIYEFAVLIKQLAEKIKWVEYIKTKKGFYEKLFYDVIKFSKQLDMNDFIQYYGYSKNSYNYVITSLINGSFCVEDTSNNLFCVRGFKYDEVTQRFSEENEYLLENLFHEYSHTYINPLIDKYFSKFDIKRLFDEAVNNGLPKCYQYPRILLYEYFVRASARY